MPAVGARPEVERSAATGMAQMNWKTMLDSLSKLLNRCSSEELVLQLLKVELLNCLFSLHRLVAFTQKLLQSRFQPYV